MNLIFGMKPYFDQTRGNIKPPPPQEETTTTKNQAPPPSPPQPPPQSPTKRQTFCRIQQIQYGRHRFIQSHGPLIGSSHPSIFSSFLY